MGCLNQATFLVLLAAVARARVVPTAFDLSLHEDEAFIGTFVLTG